MSYITQVPTELVDQLLKILNGALVAQRNGWKSVVSVCVCVCVYVYNVYVSIFVKTLVHSFFICGRYMF